MDGGPGAGDSAGADDGAALAQAAAKAQAASKPPGTVDAMRRILGETGAFIQRPEQSAGDLVSVRLFREARAR